MDWIAFTASRCIHRGNGYIKADVELSFLQFEHIYRNLIFLILFKDIFIVAVPILYGQYNMELQKRLLRAEKRKILEDLEGDEAFTAGN